MRNRLNTTLPARARAQGPEMILPPRKRETHGVQLGPPRDSSTKQPLDWQALIEQQHRENETQPQRGSMLTPSYSDRDRSGEWTMDAESTRFLTGQHAAICDVRARGASLADNKSPIKSDVHNSVAPPTMQNYRNPQDSRQTHNSDSSDAWSPALNVTGSRWQNHTVTSSHSPSTLINSASEASGLSPPPLHRNGTLVAVDSHPIAVNANDKASSNPTNVSYQARSHGPHDPVSSIPQTSAPGYESVVPRSNVNVNGTTAWQLQHPAAGSLAAVTPHDLPMLDIDWGEWDKLFPIEMNRGDLDMPLNFEQAR